MSASASPTGFVPLYELFHASVRRRPDHPAIQRRDAVLTYAQLHDRAVEHCFRLRRAGVERGSVVGILLAPGADFVAAALATLRLGGVYLPLDPRWPAARVRTVLRDAAAGAVVVSGRAPVSGWADDVPGTVVVDLADGAAPVLDAGSPATDISPRELAMVIYTSGSTGTPKGSMIEQGSVCRLVGQDQRLAIIEQDRVAQHANPAFDATTYEIWCTLAAGATLVLPPEGVTLGPNEYAELFGRCTAALIPSGLFAELARVGACRDAIGGLRLLAVGGDVLDPSAAARLEGAGSRFNVYGPTETTVAAALGPLDARSDRGSVPIGTPLEGTWCYVLDENLDQVRPGGEGELVIGGAGVGRGYLGQPGLTASRYLPDPCVPGRRVYATGDRVRLLADGSLDFLGRQDQQVKVNGFRVELGEIEAVLRRHPAVGSARVLARAAEGRRELVAAVESDRTDRAAVVGQLRTLLGETLPAYMHPRDIVVTDAFPLSPNGKFDFDALLGARHDVSAGPQPADAEHSVAHRVRRIWTEILDRPVPEDGSFFDLGGDSLLVIRLLFQVEEEFGVALQPLDLFDHPELSDFAALVAEAVGGDDGPALDETARGGPRPTPRPERIPLAYAQQRLWFLNRFEDTGALYNVPLAFRLRGALDRAALADSLDDVVARHEILRTVFPEQPDGTPVQRVLSAGPARFPFTCVEVDEAGLSAVLSAAAAQPFDLTADPPLRVVVCRMADEEHVLLLVAHHIAVDGASYGPLMRDLSTAYAARARGRAPGWTPLAVQYADYALWQRGVLGDPDSPDARLADQQRFWTRELAGIPDQLKLPTDRPRPAESAHLGARVPVTIGVELRRALAGLAEREHATVFMVLQAGLAGVLHRLGAGTDIPIGSPVAGRRATATDDMVGFFLNTLVLRTRLEGDPTFRELLGRVRTTDLAAFAHQDLPFERVVDAVGPERSLARHPLFQVMLAYLADTEVTLDLVGLGAEREAVRLDALSYDLALHLNDLRDRDALDGFLVYDPALFDEATAVGLTRRFERLLAAAAAAPDTRISALDLLSDEEAGSLIARGTGRERDRRPELLPTLFARQAARTPAAVAVVDEHGETTYAELARLVERYAAGLGRLGVGPGAVVGVYADRDCETLACLLGVLTAGGAYLPLDPGYPAERIRLMIEDSGAPLVLVGSGLDADFIDVGHRVVRLGSPELPGPETARPDRIAPSPSPQDLAYVIYTSGSTGRPKGVMITHGGLADYLAWCVEELRDAVSQGSLVHSSLSFDFTVPGLYGPLLTGGTVRFLPKGAGLPELASALAEPDFRTGLLRLTPSLAGALADHLADRSTVLDAHSIVVGGEGFGLALRESLRRIAPNAAVYNHYGPTEAVVARSVFRLRPDWTPDARATTLPIDSPLPGTRIYLLDDGLSLVAPGVDGEVYLGGDGLARGYLGRPGLTAERFLPDPFTGDGRRMFRTGDLGRWTASGGIEILGRADSQTKIRGYRVEPGEAEAALSELPGVARAAVVVARSSSGEPALVGYAVLSEGSDADAAALRAQLGQRLPGYLVPSMIELLDAIPLSPNGKLDRAALPAVRRENAPPPSADDASPLSGLVCRLFARTLGHLSVGPEDNFFELGGNSLLSIRLVGEIRRATGVDLPLRAVFEAQTPAAVVSRLQGSARSAAAPDLAAEAVLDADFTLDAVPAIGAERLKDPRAVLLTGATGFLGAFLLRAVLDRTGADVHCLVRAGDDAEAAVRLERSLRRYLLWDDALAPRILPVAGDLGRPLLGLDASRFDRLAETVDAIYHCGARVSAAEPYERLKAANVSGTREVIRLAGRRRRIPLHHVSTITTLLSDTGNEGVLAEDRRVPAGSVPAIGYAQSKWVAEELVRAAAGRGLPAAIYRPSRICGHTRTGAMGQDDAFWHYVRACIELQAAPEPRRQFAAANLIPVDYVADAIVRLAHHHAPEGNAFNLVNDADTTLSAVLERVRAAGYPVADLPYEPWSARLSGIAEREDAADGGSLSAAALIAGLAPERAEGAAARYGHARTDGALDGSDVVRPQVDDAVVDRQLRYLAEAGFLSPAPGR